MAGPINPQVQTAVTGASGPVDVGNGGGGDIPHPSLVVDAIADQLDLDSITLTLTAGAAPSTWSWLVNGSTAGLSNATVASPVFIPEQPGYYTVTCTCTIGSIVGVIADPATFLVGNGLLPIADGATGTVVITA